jgi:hypothetical protein
MLAHRVVFYMGAGHTFYHGAPRQAAPGDVLYTIAHDAYTYAPHAHDLDASATRA